MGFSSDLVVRIVDKTAITSVQLTTNTFYQQYVLLIMRFIGNRLTHKDLSVSLFYVAISLGFMLDN